MSIFSKGKAPTSSDLAAQITKLEERADKSADLIAQCEQDLAAALESGTGESAASKALATARQDAADLARSLDLLDVEHGSIQSSEYAARCDVARERGQKIADKLKAAGERCLAELQKSAAELGAEIGDASTAIKNAINSAADNIVYAEIARAPDRDTTSPSPKAAQRAQARASAENTAWIARHKSNY